ncbi:DUF4097 and DUF4098 domain-containing protein YvlB [Paenibacillus forsythiae]|uniref:DUF4097 and DUF4098 domain-containing protein YvlB n=1 Tax=Paenibacillus forsythiae TaxID=365616 RepID=A0ABU3H535_9BACL|nr:DUF4097 family beta strand repeat-containing protein [Paenibacillus forsythiae]MDT3425935.1 DUF4097 and DUF4098 domain-containing protein YvlB [Paenibacillus forsythiae]
MGRWKIGSLTAALGCIALGVIITLIQFGQLTYEALGYLWPGLLILLGLEMLLRLLVRTETRTRTSGWAIVLILLLGLMSAGQSVLPGGSLGTWLGKSHLSSVNGTVQIGDNIKAVRISIPGGKVKVNGIQGSALSYEGRLLAPGSSQSESEQAMKDYWKVSTQGDTVVLEMTAEKNLLSGIYFGFTGNSPYLNVSLPADLAVKIGTSDGSLDASDLEGGIEASTSNGRIEMREIKGGVKASTSNGSLDLQRVEGGAHITSSNGSITLEDIAGQVYAKSSNGKIVIQSPVTGNWECTSSNGSISLKLSGATDATIAADTTNGSLKGNVNWQKQSDTNGTAVLGSGNHTVKLSTTNGSVSADIAE